MLDNYLETVKKTNLVETDLCTHAHAYTCEYMWNYSEDNTTFTSSDNEKKLFHLILVPSYQKEKQEENL